MEFSQLNSDPHIFLELRYIFLQNQKELHDSITNKDWTKLTSVTAKINLLSDEFQKMGVNTATNVFQNLSIKINIIPIRNKIVPSFILSPLLVYHIKKVFEIL